MTRWQFCNFCSCLGTTLAVICFAAEAASSPPGLRRLALSQKAITESAGPILRIREDPPAAQFHGDLFARAAVLSQSSSTVAVRNTTNVKSSVASSSLPQKLSPHSGSVMVAISVNPTAEILNATDESLSVDATSAPFSATASSTAVGFHDNAITSTMSNMTSTISSVASHPNFTVLTSSPVPILSAAGANAYRLTTTTSNHSSGTSEASLSNMIPTSATTSTSPTNVAALADGIALGGALLLFSKSASKVGSDIVKPATKVASLKSLETIKSNLEKAFKDRGGVDTGGPCVARIKRFRLRKRDLASLVLNDFRCAIDSVDTLQFHLNVENPNPTVIADDLVVVGTWAQELETDEESDDDDDDEATTTSDPTSQQTMSTSETLSSIPRGSASRSSVLRSSVLRSSTPRSSTPRSSAPRSSAPRSSASRNPPSRSSASRTATISSGQFSNATCYTGSQYPFPASATAAAAADDQSMVFKLLDFALSSFFAMDPPAPFTTTSPNSTLATKSMAMSSSRLNSGSAQNPQGFLILPKPTRSPDTNTLLPCVGDGSPSYRPTSWCICATSLTYPALPPISGASIDTTANCAYTSLPSSTINPTSIPNAIPTPVPGQNGIAECVYEIVADQQDLPAGTENYCFCAGGPDVSAASAPLLTHSPTSSGASDVTDCAYTTQPTPGWTPSITATSISTTALESPTSSSTTRTSSTTTFEAAPSTCTVACTGPPNGDLDVTCVCLCQPKPYGYYCEKGQFSTGDVQKSCDPNTCQVQNGNGEISSIDGFSTSITAAPSTTPILPSSGFNCTQIEGVYAEGKNPKQINTCICNNGSRPSATISDGKYVCPSQVSIIVEG